MPPEERESAARLAAERVARDSYGKLLAFLAARSRDVAGAEDALSEAFAAALHDWPRSGVPDVPEAWLLTAARRRQIDVARHLQTRAGAADQLALLAELSEAVESHPNDIPDERLALMFACAHPAIDAAVRAPLMLQALLGFDAAQIASAFLVAPSTMAQRLVRAKAKIRQAGIPFRVPGKDELEGRLEAVLDALYAVYAEGWTDPLASDARRRNLAEEAIGLGALVSSLMPEEPEALGLVALMLHSHARRAARRNADGDYVPLASQDVALWDGAMIEQAEALLHRAGTFGRVGRYQLEAAIQSAHVVRRRSGSADWPAIATLYEALQRLTDSPVAAVNRAVAIAETDGPRKGLELLDALSSDKRLAEYQPFWAARADLLSRAGDRAEALQAYERAIGLERDESVRKFLLAKRGCLE